MITAEERTKLLMQYPWLSYTYDGTFESTNIWANYCWADDLEDGWYIAFGQDLFSDIDNELRAYGADTYEEFQIRQIKEKYGELRFNCNIELKCLDKYYEWSKKVCVKCGAPATRKTCDWINYFCEKDAPAQSEPQSIEF